ncbi:hypothetical protein ACQ9LF_06310 [Anaerohalosphaeraceae bacterium U12dextr]|jgi:hypothetical protein
MAINLTAIFGNEINVSFQPREPNNQYTGFAGAHGVTGMMMGSRGWPLIVTGVLRAYGTSYRAARNALVQQIETIEQYQFYPEQTYSYQDEIYYDVVFDKFQLIDSDGKLFKYTSEGFCVCRFIAYFRSML